MYTHYIVLPGSEAFTWETKYRRHYTSSTRNGRQGPFEAPGFFYFNKQT